MTVLLYIVFVISGAAGLIYESIWARYLGLFVGHSAYAQIIVLVMFMGGMSIGALAIGERSARLRSPLLWYAAIELAAGLIGLVFHDAYTTLARFAYASVFPALGAGLPQLAAKWSIAALLILPQSVLLGATFPLMSAGVIRLAPDRAGRSLALLYFANSLGAAAGVLVAGFYLVALAGLPGTLLVAAMLNLFVALVVFGAQRRAGPAAATLDVFAAEAGADASANSRRILLAVAFGTAIASFIYEIAWVRMLSLVLGSATHSFELMLSAFILGLALGAYWVRSRVDVGTLWLLGVVQIAMGCLAIATLPVYLASFDWMAGAMSVFARTPEGYAALSVFRYAICLAVMLPATFCAGMTLPIITRLLLRAGVGERAIGRVYSLNTLGSIVGAAMAGLVLMPALGLKGLLVLGGAIDLSLGAWLILSNGPRQQLARRRIMPAAAAIAVILLVILGSARFDTTLLTSGVFRYGATQAPGSADVLFYRDGRTATVSVRRIKGTGGLSLATNGKPDASLGLEWLDPRRAGAKAAPFTHDASTQTLLALITLAHAPAARQAAVIGLGSGMSSHMLLGSPNLAQLVTIEIEPEIVRASRHFHPANRRVFEDPRSSLAFDDARSYFAAGHRRYDLILSEPSNPWVAGVSGLFTTEFYSSIRNYLTADGILGQWLHINEIDDGLVLSVVAALARNFPAYAIFSVSSHDLLIVASPRKALPRPDWSIIDRYEPLRSDLARVVPLSPHTFETLRLADHTSLGALAARVSPNSDFYPVLDLNAERARFTNSQATGFALLGTGRFSASLALAGARNAFDVQTISAIPGVPRLDASATSAAIRAPGGPLTLSAGAAAAAWRYQIVRQSLQADVPPVDWRAWVRAVADVDLDLHGGAAGVADSAWYAGLHAYLRRTAPPPEARAAIEFLDGIAGWDYARAARASGPLVAAAQRRDYWIDPDLLLEGTVIAYLAGGDADRARASWRALRPHSFRSPSDLRLLLLESLVPTEPAR